MTTYDTAVRPARTVLEQRIWERRLTIEEFAEQAEQFARNSGESGTLSVRHLQRLVAGRRPDGRPLGPVRPATARLLEGMLGVTIHDLLAPPGDEPLSAQPLTVALAIVLRDRDVLVVQRRSGRADNAWQFPAGIVKPGAEPGPVAVRETFAESGVHCAVVRDLGSRVHPVTNVVCHYFLCRYLAGDLVNGDPAENVAVSWIDRRAVGELLPTESIYPPALQALHTHHLGSFSAIAGHQTSLTE